MEEGPESVGLRQQVVLGASEEPCNGHSSHPPRASLDT